MVSSIVWRGVIAGAEEAVNKDGESLSLVIDVAGALTEDKREKTEEAVAELLEVSEQLDGGDPGGVVLKGISIFCRMLRSALTGAEGIERPVSSASLVCIFGRLSSGSK